MLHDNRSCEVVGQILADQTPGHRILPDDHATVFVYAQWYVQDYITGTLGMTLEEEGIYIRFLMQLYQRGKPLPDNDYFVSGILRVSLRPWKRLKSALVEAGKIIQRNGALTNNRFEKERQKRADDLRRSSEAAKLRWARARGEALDQQDLSEVSPKFAGSLGEVLPKLSQNIEKNLNEIKENPVKPHMPVRVHTHKESISELKLTCENQDFTKTEKPAVPPPGKVEANGVAIYGPGRIWELTYSDIDASAVKHGVDRQKAREAALKLTKAWAAKGVEVADPAAKFDASLERLKARPQRAMAAYNDAAERYGFHRAIKLTPARSNKIGARINEVGWDQFLEALERAGRSSFCRGDNQNGWKLDFDFLCQTNGILKILEGRYDDKTATQPPSQARNIIHGMSDTEYAAKKQEMIERYNLGAQQQ